MRLKLTHLLILGLLFTGCSKDVLKRYEKRIIGDWEVEDINSYGIGSLPLDFGKGHYYFGNDRTFSYTGRNGISYTGKWEIRKYYEDCNCDDCGSDYIRTLLISAADRENGAIKSEYFDEIRFTSTNRFRATITNGVRTKIFKFRRR